MPSSRPTCQIGFRLHESLRLCHRRAAVLPLLHGFCTWDCDYALIKDQRECLLMFFLHQLLRLVDDAKMPCFTFIITCSHHFRKKSLNYILIIIRLRGPSPHFEELSPSCFYFERTPSRFRQSVIAPPRHLTNAAETPLQSSRGCEEVSLSPHAIVASDLPNRIQVAWIAPAMPSSRCPLYRSCMGFVLGLRYAVVKVQKCFLIKPFTYHA